MLMASFTELNQKNKEEYREAGRELVIHFLLKNHTLFFKKHYTSSVIIQMFCDK